VSSLGSRPKERGGLNFRVESENRSH
jgi:hypothetical protein